MQLDIQKIKKIIESRFLNVPDSIQQCFPDVLKGNVQWIAYSDNSFSVLFFLNDQEMERVKEYNKKGLQLFPGFLTGEEGIGAGMRMENSKYGMVSGCSVSGMYSFSVGLNSTFVIENHTQELNTNELGTIKYTVPLAYVVSYDENSQEDFYENLDDLISYSIKRWRETNDTSK